jgi:hypothetical protein
MEGEHYIMSACQRISAGRDGDQNIAVFDESGSLSRKRSLRESTGTSSPAGKLKPGEENFS